MFCVYECGGYCVRMDAPYIRCGVDSCEYSYPQKQTTNADHIRAMSDKEMARFLASVENRRSADGGGAQWYGMAHALKWLQQPVEEDKHETD